MFKRKNYLALGAVVLVAVLVLSLPASATSRLKLVISSWFLPLFGLANAAQQLPADLADGALPRRELTSAMLLPIGSEAKIENGFVGVLGAFEIYRGSARGHRMANLRVIVR